MVLEGDRTGQGEVADVGEGFRSPSVVPLSEAAQVSSTDMVRGVAGGYYSPAAILVRVGLRILWVIPFS